MKHMWHLRIRTLMKFGTINWSRLYAVHSSVKWNSRTVSDLKFYSYFSTLSTRLVQKRFVLGIETSCDDTGAAVVDDHAAVIGEALSSQIAIHNETGGIIPIVAKNMHAQNVKGVVEQTLEQAGMGLGDVDAIAVTVKPGLIMSLRVGMQYAQELARISRKPVIPIHHMEAHALTARMIDRIDFPFLVLLASGGHCLLAVARGIDDFLLLGSSLDVAPGDAFDKTARELRLSSLPQFAGMSGGAAVECLAKVGDYQNYPVMHVMTRRADCNFSFTGIKIAARRQIFADYDKLGVSRQEVLPTAADICAWFQFNVTYHMARRLQRAFIYTELKNMIGNRKVLVVSGGVACNAYIRANLEDLCKQYGYRMICPPVKLCTDNGIMIAWNGMEKLLSDKCYFQDPDTLDVQARCPLGTDISKDVTNTSIKLPKLKLNIVS